jgi:hypothetical protein
MKKNIIILLILLFLNNCAATGVTFLGPTFTGIATKSITRTSVSYSSNLIIKKLVNKNKTQNNYQILTN